MELIKLQFRWEKMISNCLCHLLSHCNAETDKSWAAAKQANCTTHLYRGKWNTRSSSDKVPSAQQCNSLCDSGGFVSLTPHKASSCVAGKENFPIIITGWTSKKTQIPSPSQLILLHCRPMSSTRCSLEMQNCSQECTYSLDLLLSIFLNGSISYSNYSQLL